MIQSQGRSSRWPIGLAVAIGACAALLPLRALLPAAELGLAALLLLLLPVAGPALAILSVPFQDLLPLPGGYHHTQVLVALMLACWVARALARADAPPRPGPLLLPWLALLAALLLACSLTPYNLNEGLRQTARWGAAFLVWLVASTALSARRSAAGPLTAALIIAPTVVAAIGIYQFFSGDGPPSFRIAAGLPYVRASGTIGQPNSFAGYMNMAWPLALAVGLGAEYYHRVTEGTEDAQSGGRVQPRRALSPWAPLAGVAALTLLAGLALSLSRGGWVGAAFGAFGLLLALGRRAARAVLALALIGGVVLALGAAGFLPDVLESRVASITRNLTFFDPATVTVTPENFAVVERMAQMSAGLKMVLAHPLTGVGPGNYDTVYPLVTVAPWYVSKGHAHNYYLQIAAEAGIIGLAVYLWLIVSVARQALRLARRGTTAVWRSIGVGAFGVIMAVAGHNLFENLHVLNLGIQLAGIWALAGAGQLQEDKQ